MEKSCSRLVSLDIFRGLTVAFMIIVNTPGSWEYVYSPLRHAKWHGCTPTDLVFPFFLFIVGVLVFVVLPGLKENALPVTLIKAALFGLITYATYDLTNLATVKDWPLIITIVDLLWGMVLTTIVSAAGFFIGKWMA